MSCSIRRIEVPCSLRIDSSSSLSPPLSRALRPAAGSSRQSSAGSVHIARAISSAGGIRFDELDAHFMLRQLPGVFAAGEMLDWEAPTGGYLLTACFASGRAAGLGMGDWLRARTK